MHKEQKTIFIVITRSFITRNILRSGTLERLKKAGHRIVVFFDTHEIPEYTRKEFEDAQVKLAPLHVSVGRMQKLLTKLGRYLLCSKSTKVIIYHGINSKERRKYRDGFQPERSRVTSWLRYTIARVLSSIMPIKKLYRFLENTLFPEKNPRIRHYFNIYKPDLVFATSVVSSLDIAIMKEARRRNIPTAAIPKTWDNVTNLYYRFVPDYFIVYSQILLDETVRYQDIPKEKIQITGMPQFDWYKRPEIIKSRAEHLRDKGLDPDLPLLFFGSSGIWSGNDNQIASTIYRWVKNNELAKPCQLLVRPHFSNCTDDVFEQLRGKERVVVDTYRITNFLIDSWDPSVKETIDFTNSVRHCDIMINLASSLALDAACADRPVINIGFGCAFQGGKDITSVGHYGTDHYGWVLDTKATLVANSTEELKDCINAYLLHPELKSKEREALREKLCYGVDGKSSERLAVAINKILSNQHV